MDHDGTVPGPIRRVRQGVPFEVVVENGLVAPREVVEVAFVADNPGDWMLHCQVMDHQTAG